jgi:hypothetical protein
MIPRDPVLIAGTDQIASRRYATAFTFMSVTYLVMAHRNPEQVNRLFQAIYDEDDTYIFHFDRRSHRSLHQLGQTLALRYSNVHVLRSRTIVVGGFAATRVQMDAMAAALKMNRRWHHFINLSGQDFPLKPSRELKHKLAESPDQSFIEWFDPLSSTMWQNATARVQRYHVDWVWLDRLLKTRGLGRHLRHLFGWQGKVPRVPLLKRGQHPFRYFGGSNYTVLSREACHHVVFDPRSIAILRWLKRSMHSDEIFIQTVLMNSPLSNKVINTNLHEIVFPAHSPHPKTYTLQDLPRLEASPKFFARKFDAARDPELLDRLTARLAKPVDSAVHVSTAIHEL